MPDRVRSTDLDWLVRKVRGGNSAGFSSTSIRFALLEPLLECRSRCDQFLRVRDRHCTGRSRCAPTTWAHGNDRSTRDPRPRLPGRPRRTPRAGARGARPRAAGRRGEGGVARESHPLKNQTVRKSPSRSGPPVHPGRGRSKYRALRVFQRTSESGPRYLGRPSPIWGFAAFFSEIEVTP